MPKDGGKKHPRGEYVQIDTSNILFICGGAFAGIDQIISRRLSKGSIGFNANVRKDTFDPASGAASTSENLIDSIETSDLISFGFIPEFCGRFPTILGTKTLTLEEIIQVLTQPKNAILKQYAYQFAAYGVDLHITPEALLLIAESALKRNTGARGLRSIFEKLLTTAMYVIPDEPSCHTVLVDDLAVTGKRSVLLLKGTVQLQKLSSFKADLNLLL